MHRVLHVDVDEFAVAVELLRHPELAGKAVVVGGRGEAWRRGVVSSASREARACGIEVGMPLRTAAERCPPAVFVSLDVPAYVEASRQVMRVLGSFGAVRAGWHEAYLAVEAGDPERIAHEIQEALRAATGLACSIGIGENRLHARTASALAKPAGIRVLTSENWHQVMDGRPTETLLGVGPRRSSRLADLGIETVGELARADALRVARALGLRLGPRLQRLAAGEDARIPASMRRPARSHGRELTFARNVEDPALVRSTVAELAGEVAADLADRGRKAVRVTVTVRSVRFQAHSHTVPVKPPSGNPVALTAAALAALQWLDLEQPVRTVGVRAELARPAARRAGERQLALFAA